MKTLHQKLLDHAKIEVIVTTKTVTGLEKAITVNFPVKGNAHLLYKLLLLEWILNIHQQLLL